MSAQQSSCRRYNTICCSNLWVKPLDIKGGKKKRKRGTVFPFTVLCTCQNGVFRVFFFLFLLLFYLLLLHTPARLLCNATETPSGIERRCNVSESVCVCVSVWSRTDPTIPKTHFLCLFHFRTLSHTHAHTSLIFQLWTTFLSFFFFFEP